MRAYPILWGFYRDTETPRDEKKIKKVKTLWGKSLLISRDRFWSFLICVSRGAQAAWGLWEAPNGNALSPGDFSEKSTAFHDSRLCCPLSNRSHRFGEARPPERCTCWKETLKTSDFLKRFFENISPICQRELFGFLITTVWDRGGSIWWQWHHLGSLKQNRKMGMRLCGLKGKDRPADSADQKLCIWHQVKAAKAQNSYITRAPLPRSPVYWGLNADLPKPPDSWHNIKQKTSTLPDWCAIWFDPFSIKKQDRVWPISQDAFAAVVAQMSKRDQKCCGDINQTLKLWLKLVFIAAVSNQHGATIAFNCKLGRNPKQCLVKIKSSRIFFTLGQ